MGMAAYIAAGRWVPLLLAATTSACTTWMPLAQTDTGPTDAGREVVVDSQGDGARLDADEIAPDADAADATTADGGPDADLVTPDGDTNICRAAPTELGEGGEVCGVPLDDPSDLPEVHTGESCRIFSTPTSCLIDCVRGVPSCNVRASHVPREREGMCVLVVKSLEVPDGGTLWVDGYLPVAIVALGPLVIDGTIDFSGSDTTAGPGGGGGGAIQLFSSESIVVSGSVIVDGGQGADFQSRGSMGGAGGGGAGFVFLRSRDFAVTRSAEVYPLRDECMAYPMYCIERGRGRARQ